MFRIEPFSTDKEKEWDEFVLEKSLNEFAFTLTSILNAANAVISNNTERKGKTLWTEKGDGDLISVKNLLDERDEAKFVAETVLDKVNNGEKFSDNAVLYRLNAQSQAIENAFVRSGIPYVVIGGNRFYDRKEIRDVLAYLNVILNPNDNVRLKRIINEPKRGIGETTINNASTIADNLGLSLFEVISSAEDYPAISKAATKLKDFSDMINSLSGSLTISELFSKMLEKTGYVDALRSDLTDPKNEDRIDNVKEFQSTIKNFEDEADVPTLSTFLEEIALMTDIDNYNADTDAAVMYTYTPNNADDVPAVVKGDKGAGRIQHGDLQFTFASTEDSNSEVIPALREALDKYVPSLVDFIGEGGTATACPEGTNTGNTGDNPGGDNPGGDITSGGDFECYFTGGKPSSTFYTISGNYSNSKGKATVNGTEYTYCLKLESATSVKFTLETENTIYLHFGDAEGSATIKIDGVKATATNAVITQDLAAGAHELTKDGTYNLFYINMLKDPATAIPFTTGAKAADKILRDGQLLIRRDGRLYNLQGIIVE